MDNKKHHVIIYSHGFGVGQSNRGLFSEIARSLPDIESVMFDYNPIHEVSKTITVKPLPEQALKLRRVIREVRAAHPEATIDLVCHSQGCVVAALLKPRDIRKIIMLTPPADISQEAVVGRLNKRNDIEIDVATRTRLQRTDGSTTVIQPEYWQGLQGIDALKLYKTLSRFTQLRIINAKQDEVLGDVDFDILKPEISVVALNGSHNFDDEEDRKRILYILNKELAA